jgi:putative hydrolase of the HAD superfamily
MVLTGPQDPEAHAMLMQLTGLPLDRFEQLYWADRIAYDAGSLTGLEFWQKLLRDAKLELPAGSDHQLNEWDARMWSTVNPAMVAWQQQLSQHGVLTGILSNMGDSVLALIEKKHAWLGGFDAKVWSYQLRMVKPDPAIYRHVLGLVGTRAEETLFLDDKLENIEAAKALGIKAIQFSTVEKLREDLIAADLEKELSLP